MILTNQSYDFNHINETILQQAIANTLEEQGRVDVAKRYFCIRVIVCFIYSVIFILGVIGNLLVVYAVLRKSEMRSITNLFITNLAISDILMSLIATPFTPFFLYMEGWSLPWALCKLLPMTMAVTVYVSTITSMAIAIDRYFVIVYPFAPRMKTWQCLLIVILTWMISSFFSLPLAVYQQTQFDYERNISACQENWPQQTSRAVFTVVNFILQFIVPCSIISGCYVRISIALCERAKRKIGWKSKLKEEADVKRKRRVNRMLIAMVVIFVVCWIPLNGLWMITDLASAKLISSFPMSDYFTLIFFICHIFAMSSAVYNPFLYAWMNDSFRQEFRLVLPCLNTRPNCVRNRSQLVTDGATPLPNCEQNLPAIGNELLDI